MIVPRHCFQKLAFITFTSITNITFHANSANPQITPDATLPNNSSVRSQDNTKIIEGGTQAGGNLFHSFEKFSVPAKTEAYFNNTLNTQNIITRITGNSISNIDGIIRTNGTANLFLMNPNGIIFGENASLNIGGSFLATTASSIKFADGTTFSAVQPQTTPLLTVSVPIGLQFGATPAPIRNQSQASVNGAINSFKQPVGLQVPKGETLALVGGDVILEGGNLTADSGRIELGSVAGNSFVSLNSIKRGWTLGYEGVKDFGNIQLTSTYDNGVLISSYVDVSGEGGGASIHVQGNYVELTNSLLNAGTTGVKDAGNLTINARKLVLRDGAQVRTSTSGKGAAGNLIVNASESVQLIGRNFDIPSLLSSATSGSGNAGNITINTSRLLVRDGAVISVGTSGQGDTKQFTLATGEGGHLIVNATEQVEVVGEESALTSETLNTADAGNLTISTKKLIVRDGAAITSGSQLPKLEPDTKIVGDTTNLGNAGEINITADSIVLDNEGKIVSTTELGKGGNINLQLQDLLLMRRNSEISTSAGIAQLAGDGGNITINIFDGFIVTAPSENSDITANAFSGSGGRVEINAIGMVGMKERSRDELVELLGTNEPIKLNPANLPTNDITAISQLNPNLNGELVINAPDVEVNKGILQFPDVPLDNKLSQICDPVDENSQSKFIYTRNGGVPPLPGEELRSDSPLDADWVSLGEDKKRRRKISNSQNQVIQNQVIQNPIIQNPKSKIQNPIVEATGWVVDKNGDIFLTAGKVNQLAGVVGSDRASVVPTLPCDAAIKNNPG
jgi:filamentous hemagglutinin family protein